MSVSKLANNLKGSEIIKIGNEINELKRQGAQIANLTIGDFDPQIYPIPDALKEGIIKAYQNHQTNYPVADGMPVLRERLSKLIHKQYQLAFESDEILVASGSRPLIYATFLALVDPGDKVVFPAPSWNNNHYVNLTNAVGVSVETDEHNNFMPTAADLKPHLSGATLLALCSPLNPTGTMFAKKDLEAICDLILEENATRKNGEKPLYLLYDQIYAQLTFGKNKHFDPVSLRPELRDYVIYIDGASKCFAATGVRVGWGFGPKNIIGKMKSILSHVGAWAPKAEQMAMADFLAMDDAVNNFLADFKTKIDKSLECLYQGFQALKAEGFKVDAINPMGAIYLTVKMDYAGKTTPDGDLIKNAEDLNFYLIKQAGAALVPFSAFGTGNDVPWFRASVGGCSLQDIEQMIPRIKEALSLLK